MDLYEHGLNEGLRRIKRLGITYVFQDNASALAQEKAETSAPDSDVDATVQAWTPSPALQALFHEKQCPALTLWTYDGLTQDLELPKPPARLEVLRKIQESVCTHLGWQPSRIATWPLGEEEQAAHYGLEHFTPALILIFALSVATPTDKCGQFCRHLPDQPVIFLPDINSMATGDRESKNKAWKILNDLSSQRQF